MITIKESDCKSVNDEFARWSKHHRDLIDNSKNYVSKFVKRSVETELNFYSVEEANLIMEIVLSIYYNML